jgi:heme oxygenase
MAMLRGHEKLSACTNRRDVTEAYRASNIVDLTLRNETLRNDLAALLGGRLSRSISNLPAALTYVQTVEEINASDRVDRYESNPVLSDKLTRRLEEREWPLYEFFGY